jgi:hypothetical protein
MIYRAVVTDNRDPRKLGRLRVQIPHLGGGGATDWIWPIVPNGFWVIPRSGEQVWVMFEAGDQEMPAWLGSIKPRAEYTDPNTGTELGSVGNLLYRVVQLEEDVQELFSRVAALESRLSSHEGSPHGG